MNAAKIQVFTNENKAYEIMRSRNSAAKRAGNFRDVLCVVDHPEGWALMDLNTAIANDFCYIIEY
jgi:hypothetical protein